MTPGRLTVVGTPIGNLGDLSPRAATALAEADVIACEDTRHTRRLLAAAAVTPKSMIAVHEHNEAMMADAIVERVRAGERVVLVSDAGMPAISDPGERVVRAVAGAGLAVEVVPGPSAGLTALVASGLPAARWCFEGFLPRKGSERRARLAVMAVEPRTAILYEAPTRVVATLTDLAAACGPERRVVVARELTKLFEQVWRGRLGDASAAVGQPRGEYVIVLDGAPPMAPPTDAAITEQLHAALVAGVSPKVAVSTVAAALGVPRRRVYELNLRGRGARTAP